MSVAPRPRARASFAGSRSTATIRPAPAIRAAATICWPIPPQPTTHTLSPIATRAALRTAPKPVTTAQPSSAACQSGRPGGIGTALAAGTTQRSAKHDTKLKCLTSRPSARCSRVVPSSIVPAQACAPATSQRLKRPAVHAAQARHGGTKQNATGSPAVEPLHPRPDGLDHARALVAQDGRPAAVAEVAVGEADVRVAHARGGDADEHLARARRVERERLDAQRGVRLVEDGGADLHQAMRCSSRRSRSGTTPRPGPGGGAIVPSAAISTVGPPSSQSRRPGVHPGGSSGTSR